MQLSVLGDVPKGASPADETWRQITRYAVFALATLLVAYLGWYLHVHSDFSNDDLDNFLLSQRLGFWEFVSTPTNVHYVPLHRFLSWLVYRVAPMNYSVVIAIVLAFHVGTMIVMARSLCLLRVGQIGGLIVCGYAASSLIIYGVSWWANAQHRVTFVFFDICAIYNYVAWIKNGKRVHLLLMAVVFALAFGVYEKAIFIPLHMLLIGYLSDEPLFRARIKRFLIPPFCGLFLGLVYAGVYLLLNRGAASVRFSSAISADLEFAKSFFGAAFGLTSEDIQDASGHAVPLRLECLLALLGSVFLLSLWRGRGNWKIVLAAVIVVMFDNLPLVLSSRYVYLLHIVVHESRYAYEELQLLALLVGIWCKRFGLAELVDTGGRWVWSLGFVAVLAYAAVNISYERAALQNPISWLSFLNDSRRYMRNLRPGIAEIKDAAPVFQNDRVPAYMSLFHTISDTRALLPLMLPRAKFDDRAVPRYSIMQNGRVVQLH